MPRPHLQPDTLVLYPFRYRDERTGKWVQARYVAERDVIAERHTEWELIGPPEIRHVTHTSTGSFLWEALRRRERASNVDMRPIPEDLHELEVFLLRTFLQRYATWCIRTRRYAQAQGAAHLAREIRSPADA